MGSNVAGVHELWSRNAFSPSISPGLGYQAGVYYRVPLGPQWALVPELQFSRESQQVRREGFPYDVYYYQAGGYLVHDYRTSFSFLTVPMVVRRRIGPVYAELGPQVSFLLGGRSTGETRIIGSQVERAIIDQAATDYCNRVEAGICLGVGLRLPAGWGRKCPRLPGASAPSRPTRRTMPTCRTLRLPRVRNIAAWCNCPSRAMCFAPGHS